MITRAKSRSAACVVLLVAVWSGLFSGATTAGDGVLLVHEWGTFTSLQDEQGSELSGINTDDEPLPKFVHDFNPFLVGKPLLSSQHWIYRQKAAPRSHPYVTM